MTPIQNNILQIDSSNRSYLEEIAFIKANEKIGGVAATCFQNLVHWFLITFCCFYPAYGRLYNEELNRVSELPRSPSSSNQPIGQDSGIGSRASSPRVHSEGNSESEETDSVEEAAGEGSLNPRLEKSFGENGILKDFTGLADIQQAGPDAKKAYVTLKSRLNNAPIKFLQSASVAGDNCFFAPSTAAPLIVTITQDSTNPNKILISESEGEDPLAADVRDMTYNWEVNIGQVYEICATKEKVFLPYMTSSFLSRVVNQIDPNEFTLVSNRPFHGTTLE